ncbi:MAG: hypothetical protein VX833_05845 [Actinomycetota bacterium]|nr:hypothetical protein [Actinomycetota bacterium]
MPTSAVLLVLASALLHAGWNRLLHRSDDPPTLIVVSYLGSGLVLLPALILDPPVEVIGWAALSGVAHAVYLNMLGFGYQEGSLSVVYPIARGTAPLLIGLGGWALLNETPSIATAAGLVVLTGGLLLLAGLANRLQERRAVMFAIATGLATVGYSLIDARSVDQTGALGYLAALMLFGSSLVLAVRRPALSRIRSVARDGILIGLGQGGAYALILVAFQRAQAAQVAGLRQISVVIGTLVAREALGPRAFWGSVAVATGAVLVIW